MERKNLFYLPINLFIFLIRWFLILIGLLITLVAIPVGFVGLLVSRLFNYLLLGMALMILFLFTGLVQSTLYTIFMVLIAIAVILLGKTCCTSLGSAISAIGNNVSVLGVQINYK